MHKTINAVRACTVYAHTHTHAHTRTHKIYGALNSYNTAIVFTLYLLGKFRLFEKPLFFDGIATNRPWKRYIRRSRSGLYIYCDAVHQLHL